MRVIAVVVALLFLSGCGKYLTDYGNELQVGEAGSGPWLPEAGYTMASSSRDHGIQIGYWAEGGDYALWYPGNWLVLPGTWRMGRTDRIYCFSYDIDTRNRKAGTETCAWIPSSHWVAKMPGDVFNLMSGRLPAFDLTRCILPEPLVLLNDEPCLPTK